MVNKKNIILFLMLFCFAFTIFAKDYCFKYNDIEFKNNSTLCLHNKKLQKEKILRISKREAILKKKNKTNADLWWLHLNGKNENEYDSIIWSLANS